MYYQPRLRYSPPLAGAARARVTLTPGRGSSLTSRLWQVTAVQLPANLLQLLVQAQCQVLPQLVRPPCLHHSRRLGWRQPPRHSCSDIHVVQSLLQLLQAPRLYIRWLPAGPGPAHLHWQPLACCRLHSLRPLIHRSQRPVAPPPQVAAGFEQIGSAAEGRVITRICTL